MDLNTVDERYVFVTPGTTIRVGWDENCDVVLPALGPCLFNGRCITTRRGCDVLVSCTTEGDLLLALTGNSIRVIINGVQIKPSFAPRKLPPGAVVSFNKLSREFSFIFVARDLRAAKADVKHVPPPENSAADIARLEEFLLTLNPQPLLSHAQFDPESASLRSQHFVTLVDSETITHQKVSTDEILPSTLTVTEVAPTEEELVADARTSAQSLTSQSVSLHNYVRRFSTSGGFTSLYYNEEAEFLQPHPTPYRQQGLLNNVGASPHIISSVVVELWGRRVALRNVADFCDSNVDQPQINLTGDAEDLNGAETNPYITFHGVKKMGGRQQRCMDKEIRSAAENVLEYLNDAYESNDDNFIELPQQAKDKIFEYFLLLATHMMKAVKAMPVALRLTSPVVCCGDVHGSFSDLKQIFDNVVPFKHWSLMTRPVLFLGDYVDRGPHDVEVMLFLFAWCTLCPENVFLLRGNHEDDRVNGDTELYGETSFLVKCLTFFGEEKGSIFWRRVNDVFAVLPLVAIIDDTTFVCHGGIPRLRGRQLVQAGTTMGDNEDGGNAAAPFPEWKLWQEHGAENGNSSYSCDGLSSTNDAIAQVEDDIPGEDLMQELLESVPGGPGDVRFYSVMPDDNDDCLTAKRRRIARELLWNDPCTTPSLRKRPSLPQGVSDMMGSFTDEESGNMAAVMPLPQRNGFNSQGFRCNHARGCSVDTFHEFNSFALDNFLQRWGFTLVIRAHEQKDAGLEVGLAQRVLTLFSCSNYTGGDNNGGACVIVGGEVRPVSWRRPCPVLGRSPSADDPDIWKMKRLREEVGRNNSCSSYLHFPGPQIVPSYVGKPVVNLG